MQIMKKILKAFLLLLGILFIFVGLFFAQIIFSVITSGALFMDSEDVIYENWHIRLPKDGEEIYYTSGEVSFHGDGERYSVYEYENNIDNAFHWKSKKDKHIEVEVNEIIERLKEEDVKISEKYKVDFNKKYKYFIKTEEDNSHLYLIYTIEENRIYVIEDIY